METSAEIGRRKDRKQSIRRVMGEEVRGIGDEESGGTDEGERKPLKKVNNWINNIFSDAFNARNILG